MGKKEKKKKMGLTTKIFISLILQELSLGLCCVIWFLPVDV